MRNKYAFTLVEVLVVVAILGLLAAVGVPAMMNAHQNAQKKAGEINIVSVEAAIDQYAVINNMRPGEGVAFTNIMGYLGGSIRDVEDLDIGTTRMWAIDADGGSNQITQAGDSMTVGCEFQYAWPF